MTLGMFCIRRGHDLKKVFCLGSFFIYGCLCIASKVCFHSNDSNFREDG